MGNYTIFRCSKILGEAGKQEILQQMFRKFWISNRLPNRYFPKLTLGAPDVTVVVENLHAHIVLRTVFSTIVT